MLNFKVNSIKSNLILYLILFSTVPVIILSSITLYDAYHSKKNDLYNKHMQVVKQVETDTESIIRNIETIGNYIKDTYHFRKDMILTGIMRVNKNVSAILILDENGRVKDFNSHHKSPIFKGFDLSNTRYFQKIKSGAQFYWSEVYFENAIGAPVISYSVKIDEKNILTLIIDLTILNDFASKFKSGDGSSMVRIINKNGTFLAHPENKQFVHQRKSIVNLNIYKNYIAKNRTHEQFIFKSSGKFVNIGVLGKNEKMGWFIVVKEDYDYIFKTFFNVVSFVVIATILLMVLVTFFARKLSKSILKPLDEVSSKMNDIAHGNYVENFNNNNYEELKQLTLSFLIMQKKIHHREVLLKELNQTLEDRISNKTKELKKLNESLEDRVRIEIAANRQKELQIFESAKMIQMGEMIGNIAHQWRQPLSVISTAASGMKMEKDLGLLEDQKMNYYCDAIVENTEFLSDTIETFRNFIREDKTRETVILQERIEVSINILSAVLESNHIKVFNNISEVEPIKINMIIGELSQVIINLINNSKDVLIERNIDEPWIKIDCQKDEKSATITIEDNGGGIPTKILPKIFDPYFTTKHKSQGTGLGLHMSYKIINESLGGKITASNTINGALFTIIIPLD